MAEVAGGRALVIQCHGPSGLYDEERSDLFKLSLLVANFRYDLKMLYARWLRVADLFVLLSPLTTCGAARMNNLAVLLYSTFVHVVIII